MTDTDEGMPPALPEGSACEYFETRGTSEKWGIYCKISPSLCVEDFSEKVHGKGFERSVKMRCSQLLVKHHGIEQLSEHVRSHETTLKGYQKDAQNAQEAHAKKIAKEAGRKRGSARQSEVAELTAALEKVTLEKKVLEDRYLPKAYSSPPPDWRPPVDWNQTMDDPFDLYYHLTTKYPNDTTMHPKLEKIHHVRQEGEYLKTLNQLGRKAAAKGYALFDSVHRLARRDAEGHALFKTFVDATFIHPITDARVTFNQIEEGGLLKSQPPKWIRVNPDYAAAYDKALASCNDADTSWDTFE